jgi:hypothetical protein
MNARAEYWLVVWIAVVFVLCGLGAWMSVSVRANSPLMAPYPDGREHCECGAR